MGGCNHRDPCKKQEKSKKTGEGNVMIETERFEDAVLLVWKMRQGP